MQTRLRSRLASVALCALAFVLGAHPLHAKPQPSADKKQADKVIVSDVLIQGNRLIPTENIKNQMKTRVGREYLPEMLQDDVRTLFSTRQFGNVWADCVKDGPRRVKVMVYIREFPSTVQRVTYRGNHALSKDDLDGITNIRAGIPLNPIANKVACRKVIQRYSEEGRPFASCVLVKGADVNDAEVVFRITEGPKVKVAWISFTGNTFVSSPVLRQRIDSTMEIIGIGGTFNGAMADHDVQKLTEYYRSFGYHDVKVNRELVYSKDGREVKLIYHIDEGPRYRLADVPEVSGAKSVTRAELEAIVQMKQGDLYEESKINKDTQRLKDYLGYRGHDARITAVPVFSQDASGTVKLTYEVEEKQPARVGNILVVGGTTAQQNLVRKQVPLRPGQVLTYPRVKQAEEALSRLNVFPAGGESGMVVLTVVEDGPIDPKHPVKNILISIQEAGAGKLLQNVGGTSSGGTASTRPPEQGEKR